MLSGRDTLQRIDLTLRTARRDIGRLDAELQETSRSITENKLQQARAIDRLAGMRLDAARRGEVGEILETATREALAVIEARDAEIAAISDRVRASGESIEALEQRRDALHEEVDAAARTLAEREAAVQRRLEQDEAFKAQLERTRAADAVAVSAQEKAELAAADSRDKAEPFEACELFTYLWRRGYGTSAYAANPLARLLDGRVARLCGYREARPNYWMLLEIPERLAEHADKAREAAEAELDKLQDIEEAAAEEGDVPQASAALTALEKSQDELDAEIAAAEEARRELLEEQNRYSAGEDDYLRKALRVISAAMERKDLSELTRLARATMTVEDDAIVDEIRQLREQYDDLEDELRENRELQRERLAHLEELEAVRRDFKRNRYDDLHSRFDKTPVIERMIADVITGVVRGGTLWNVLRRHQRYADAAGEWPDFGSGGIVRPGRQRKRKRRQRPPSWHWPGPAGKSGRGGFKVPRPRGGSGGRGGFRTGGGF